MKTFDLDVFGVKEMERSKLIEVNGGEVQEIPNPWTSLWGTITQMVYYFTTQVLPELQKQLNNRAAKDGYIPYADIGHR